MPAPPLNGCPVCGYLYRPLETICPRCSEGAAAAAPAEFAAASTPESAIIRPSNPLSGDSHDPATDSAADDAHPAPESLSAGAKAWAIAALVWGVFHTVALGFLVVRYVFSVVILLAPIVLPLPLTAWSIARGGENVLKQVPGARRVLQMRLGLGASFAFLLLAVYRYLVALKRFPLDPAETLDVLHVSLILSLEFVFLLGLYLVSKARGILELKAAAAVDTKR